MQEEEEEEENTMQIEQAVLSFQLQLQWIKFNMSGIFTTMPGSFLWTSAMLVVIWARVL